ncbi:hypothetical protein [Aeoliella mucimassa]|uniref:PEP-CTERM protein-sorting domain-containing protein n=1 Tax=Aeoliella mucimassa TaxID=2527972 RepID=A0A518AQN7_9BACT|nr:hypothetical protein [Aeoliella mucimassa]QDU57040.1 hypothetical protein Pan181_32540 [Aeoliella mucimassa]
MRKVVSCGVVLVAACCSSSQAADPYNPVPVFGPPLTGPGVIPAIEVYGKEFSHDLDYSAMGGADPQQVINWDGHGGTMDGIDYSNTRPNWELDQQVDAIANQRDALFRQLIRDDAHLVYSHDDEVTVYPGGPMTPYKPIVLAPTDPVVLASGQKIGGPAELSVELSGVHTGANIHDYWVPAPGIDRSVELRDVDGVELWGPEPTKEGQEEGVFVGDADKYSLELDFESGASIWNASGTPYLSHSMIVSAVESLLGPIPGHALLPHQNQESRNAIDIDALMVYDTAGDVNIFNDEPVPPSSDEARDQIGRFIGDQEPRDTVIFSIRQIVDELSPDGYYATGSELFVLDSLSGVHFLEHGGHVWDKGYSMSELRMMSDDQEEGFGVIDLNALEAIGEAQEIPVGPCPGDFNGDGLVDLGDYTIWRDNLGSTDESKISSNGYLNGVIDSADYDLWKNNFGHVCMSPLMASSPTSVPEPSTLWMVAAAAGLGLLYHRNA